MAGALKTYAFINAKLRARLSKILSEEVLHQMIRAGSLPECVQILKNTDFAVVAKTYTDTGDVRMAELELFEKEVALYLEIERFLSGKELALVQALAARFEIETLVNGLRLWFDQQIRGRSIEGAAGYLYRGTIHYPLNVDELILAPDLQELAHALGHTPYGVIVQEEAERVEATESLFPLEVALDQFFYRTLLTAAGALRRRDREIAERMIGVEIDLQNINWLVRLQGFYDLESEEALRCIVPAGLNLTPEAVQEAYSAGKGETLVTDLVSKKYPQLAPLLSAKERQQGHERLALIERVLDEILQIEVRHALLGYPFTIGVVLAYFVLKRNETHKVITILNAKSYDWPEDAIAAML